MKLERQGEDLTAAHEAVTNVEQTLRCDQLRPIFDQANAIWAQLRQESNVELREIALTGRNIWRAVNIQAAVDDANGNALAVMSQGELSSLALALFLPRAVSAASPFRFLVLDDPVRAMDPTKVDGLAAVLSDLAKTGRSIVFSHGDRHQPTPPGPTPARRSITVADQSLIAQPRRDIYSSRFCLGRPVPDAALSATGLLRGSIYRRSVLPHARECG